MKPTDSSRSRGVVLVHSRKELLNEYNYTKGNSRGGAVMVEEYMQENEVSVEVMAVGGIPQRKLTEYAKKSAQYSKNNIGIIC